MARKASSSTPGDGSGKVAVKLDAGIARDLKTVASYRGLDLSELLGELLRPIAAEMIAGLRADLVRREQQESDL